MTMLLFAFYLIRGKWSYRMDEVWASTRPQTPGTPARALPLPSIAGGTEPK